MSVKATNPQYNTAVDRWITVRDVVNSNVKDYIKDVDTSDPSRSVRYKDDARFTNFTGRTKNGLVGAVFRKNPEINLPTAIEYLRYDATGNKLSLVKLAQETTGEVLQAGRFGLLVDFPASEDGLTQAEVEDMDLKARIYKYKAENITNWQIQMIKGQAKLTMVVLKERNHKLGEGGFLWEEVVQYRVLRIIEGVYVQQLWNDSDEMLEQYVPRSFDGSNWDHIPFAFVGSEDNDAEIDSSPLYDLAELNIGHLRNSADYEESVHIIGQPTTFITTDLSADAWKAANPNGIQVGARRGHHLGTTGSAIMLQPNPNQLADEAMRRKEEQAVMIGARLITPASVAETAEAARLKHSGENSVLSIIAKNVEDAINRCLDWCMIFMSNEEMQEDEGIMINDQFFDLTIDPQLVMAQIQLFNNGLIAKADLRSYLRKVGTIDESRTDEDIDEEVEDIDPLAGNDTNPFQE